MKKFILMIVSVLLSCIFVFSGCGADGKDGRDGKDGQDVSFYDAYEAAKTIEGNENLTLDEFLREYWGNNYSAQQISQSVINRSLMSSVSILTRFSYTKSGFSAILGGIGSTTTYSVFIGSGVIVWLDSEAGDAYVVTNCHVVYDDTSDTIFSNDIRLYLYGQDVYGYNYTIDANKNISDDENYRIDAEVIGASVTYDIALLKVTGSEVLKRSQAFAASFSYANDCYVGAECYAVGNAEGEGISASNGIISKDSEFIDLNLSSADTTDLNSYRVLRTTAAVNHGNSGGGLFNSQGELIGIINSKDDTAEVDNMGYALPASNVRRLLQLMYDSYVSNGKFVSGVSKALINIGYEISDSYATYEYVQSQNAECAVISEVIKVSNVNGSPAKGKLQVGDVIKGIKVVALDGTIKEDMTVTRQYHVTDVLFSVRLNDTVELTVIRGNDEIEVKIPFNSNSYFYNFA